MKRSFALLSLLLAAACGIAIPSQTPPPVVTTQPVIETPAPEPAIAILTVVVEPNIPGAEVAVNFSTWTTRPDGSIVEEFTAGQRLQIAARAPGYRTSDLIEVEATAGRMAPIRITLEALPVEPQIEPPVIETPVDEIPPGVWVTIRRFVAAYPIPLGDGSDAYIDVLRDWTGRLAEQLRYSHGPEWGHKSTSPAAPRSKEAIARKIGDDLHVWDMLTGAATGHPVLAGHPSHYFVPEQHFIEVAPIDHLAAVAPPAARSQIPQPWIGLTSFDLGVRLEAGDRRWVDMLAAEGFTVARVVVASVYRTERTIADGLRQLPLTLSTLAEAGLRAEVVVLVDTRAYDMTRESMRAYLRRVVAIAEVYEGAIAGIEIANESTHGTQVEDLSDATFLRELNALVPTKFATSCGSSHGGEAPFVSVCSYVTHHADRDRTPEQNGAIMLAAQRASGLLVVDDEGLGIAEEARPAARTSDPSYGEQQARVAKAYGLGGVTLHLEAGLTANVDLLGPVQREAIRRFVAAMKGGK